MRRLLYAAAVTTGVVIAAATAACGRSTDAASDPAIVLTSPPEGGAAYIEVTGLPDEWLAALRRADFTAGQWSELLRVAVTDEAPGMLGAYGVVGGALRFTPQYPLDPGRQYHVRFDPAQLPEAAGPGAPALVASVGLPALRTAPTTMVARVYPTGDIVPENLLRMYIEFSGPMGRQSGIEHMKLLDEDGREIPGAFLPLDYEFWSPDHTRFTAFFDPGRVKDGILPNQQMGRALQAGRPVTLVVGREWRDQHGLPLKEEFRRVLRVGAAQTEPLDPATWRIQPPPSVGRRDGVIVTFPTPLDRGLLLRALGVTRGGSPVEGDVLVDEAETRWTFTPAEPWRAGTYELLALDILEDVAGNQIGRAFEVDQFETVDRSPEPTSITIPFQVGAAPSR
jgi:hypothetical protein